MDEETVKAKMVAELDRLQQSRLATVFGWRICVDGLNAFLTMSPRMRREPKYLLKVNFEDFPRQAPSCVFVDPKTRLPGPDAWPRKVKHGQQPDGICVAGTRECHAHYHKNEAQYVWDPTTWTLLETLSEIHRLLEKGIR